MRLTGWSSEAFPFSSSHGLASSRDVEVILTVRCVSELASEEVFKPAQVRLGGRWPRLILVNCFLQLGSAPGFSRGDQLLGICTGSVFRPATRTEGQDCSALDMP